MIPIPINNLPGPQHAGLLDAECSLLTSLCQRGLCSSATAMAKMVTLVGYNAIDALSWPVGEPENGLEADSEPLVTITESLEHDPSHGEHRMLSEANTLTDRLNQLSQKETRYARHSYARINFIRNGYTDVYVLPIEFGAGCGSMLEQMGRLLHEYRKDDVRASHLFEQFPAEYRRPLRAELLTFIHECVWERTWYLLDYFQFHCDISATETRLRNRAATQSELSREVYLIHTMTAISRLRRAANSPNGKRPRGWE